MIGVLLEPVDTWFFRDGTPFGARSAVQDSVGSLFPPHPTTAVGALRAAIALDNGWDGRDRWPDHLIDILGDGPDELGALAVDGPFVLWKEDPLFAAPRHLLGSSGADGGWTPSTLLRPGPAVVCDLGDAVRLPEAPIDSANAEIPKTGEGQWLTQAGMESVLAGELPAVGEIVRSEALWREEFRIGLERDVGSRTAIEGMLYSTRHIRLRDKVAIGLRVSGVPEHWNLQFGNMVPLGGESRVAEIGEWSGKVAFDQPSEAIMESGQVTVVALSPLDIEQDAYCGRKTLEELGGARIVSACLGRPQRIGGWNSLERVPLPLRCVLPPGSVLFCELPERGRDVAATDGGLIRLGARQQWGFGLAAVGSWPK